MQYVYSFDERDCGHQRQEITTVIEAARHGVSIYEAKYRWSGAGTSRLSLSTPGQILLDDPLMTYRGWTYYYVWLLRPLNRGERTEIKIIQEVKDTDRSMAFQLTKTIRESLESLVLQIQFPASGPAREDIWAVERRSVLNDADVRRRIDVAYDSIKHTATLTIPRPKPGRTYAIEWLWNSYRQSRIP